MSEHEAQYRDPEFHNRLKQDWPEDGEQLHSGGWARTKELMDIIDNDLKQVQKVTDVAEISMLDLCCGEGSTPIYFAREKGWRSVGIDINEQAIENAGKAARAKEVGDLATFVAGSAFELPFEDNSFHVVYGQDPDAFSINQFRLQGFKSAFAKMKPNGLFIFHHHWVPAGPSRGKWTPALFEQYCKESGSDPVHTDMYIDDLKAAGFIIEQAENVSELSKSHLSGQFKNMQERCAKTNTEVQPWLKVTLDYLSQDLPWGIEIRARKPPLM